MADALLENVRIYNGASEQGGALAIFPLYSYSSGTAEVVVDSCLLLGNNATQSGGALFASQGVVTVQASTFMNNTAMSMTGGHIAIESDASLVLSNSALSGGTAPSGGGLSVAGNATILSALLTQNLATAGGGGALYVTGSAVVNHSHFWGNRFVGTDAEELVSLGAHQPLCEYRGLTRTVHPPPCQICDTLEMIAAWGTGWYGSILTIWDSSDTLVFSSAGPEEYFLSASFCYMPGETYSFEVSQIQGWYFNYYSWIAPSIINWDFADGLVADNGDETVTTFVGPAASLDVSCVSLWKHSLLPEPFMRALLSKAHICVHTLIHSLHTRNMHTRAVHKLTHSQNHTHAHLRTLKHLSGAFSRIKEAGRCSLNPEDLPSYLVQVSTEARLKVALEENCW